MKRRRLPTWVVTAGALALMVGLMGCSTSSSSVRATEITISAGTPSDGSSVVSGVWTPSGTNGATLQLNAVISPSDATNKAVTWSANYTTGYLSISSTGLITIDDTAGDPTGGVIITATATDGSGVTATFGVNLTNWG